MQGRMVHLAADNDWVHFLAEASTQSYSCQEVSAHIYSHIALTWAIVSPPDPYLTTFLGPRLMPESLSLAPGGCRSGFNGVMQVVHSALEYFEDGSLQHHILHVLHGLALDETSGPPISLWRPTE